jgi:hypothetical protein
MIPTHLIVHCSDSEWGTARVIREWHLQRGFKDIGYQFVILNGRISPTTIIPALNGSIEIGRGIDEVGAHCLGFNDHSLGICGIAKSKWMPSQEISLCVLLLELSRMFKIPVENIVGHGETASGRAEGKTCPNLDMDRIRSLVEGKKS